MLQIVVRCMEAFPSPRTATLIAPACLPHCLSEMVYSSKLAGGETSGSLDVTRCLLDGGDGFINPVQRVGFEPFRVRNYILPRSPQTFPYVIRFIALAIHGNYTPTSHRHKKL